MSEFLNIRDEKKFEVTSDNYYDLLVKLNSIESNKADVSISYIHEEFVVGEEELLEDEIVEEEIVELESKIRLELIIISLVILVLIVIVVVFVVRKKKR